MNNVQTTAESIWHNVNVMIDTAGNWLSGHDRMANIITISAVFVFCLILFRVEARTWWGMRWQRDRTSVGGALRSKKLWYAVMFLCWSALYGLSLWAIFEPFQFGIWERLGLRLALIASMGMAALYGERFLSSLDEENWGRPDTTARQAATDVRQDRREHRQDTRSASQQRREDRQERRDATQDARDRDE